jgi:hypothetical protein
MQLKEVEIALNKFAKYVVKQAKTNLSRKKGNRSKNTSKKLYNSIKYKVSPKKDKVSLAFEMEDYGAYQDQGVSGKKKKYKTPFSYKDKMPPPSSLDKWIVRKKLAPRKNGKFTDRKIDKVGFQKSIQFLIARSIFMKGIKPSLFFTRPFEKAFKDIPNDAADAFVIDIEEELDFLTELLKDKDRLSR